MAIEYSEKINAYHITDNPELYDIARSNVFEFFITGVDALLKAGVDEATATADDMVSGITDTIRLSVTKAFVPHFKQNVIEVQRGNTKAKYAGAIEYQSGSLVVNDFVGINSKSCLMAWQRLSGDETTGAVGRAENYKKDCYLVEYTPDFKPIRQWLLKGCFISELTEDDFDSESDAKRQITATIEYDRAIPEDLYKK